jgi:hypothetical protein
MLESLLAAQKTERTHPESHRVSRKMIFWTAQTATAGKNRPEPYLECMTSVRL